MWKNSKQQKEIYLKILNKDIGNLRYQRALKILIERMWEESRLLE